MVICIDCGHRIVDDIKFCPQCGCPIEESYNNSTPLSPFDETIIMSTEKKIFQFYSGVKIVEIDRKINSDVVTLIYEVYNPTQYLIQIEASNGTMFNMDNEIINKQSYGYFDSDDEQFPINPNSKALIRLKAYYNTDDNECFGKIIQLIKTENVTKKYEIEKNIKFTRAELFEDFGKIQMWYSYHDISNEICKDRIISWRCLWLDRCNNIVCQSTNVNEEIGYHNLINGTTSCVYMNDNPYFNNVIIYIYKKIT